MKIARLNNEYIEVNENTLPNEPPKHRVHLVKLNFMEPTIEKLNKALEIFNQTNRFIIDDYIKFYNDYFKNTSKKYYVENADEKNMITFFRKNNKVLFNFTMINESVFNFLIQNLLYDILRNVEVIKVTNLQFKILEKSIDSWKGNIVVIDG